MDGFLNFLKPTGPTSFQAINKIKMLTGAKKVGHTGTLDPGAAGVLPVCLGRGTKLSQFVTQSKRKYRAEITFGTTTDTQDSYGKILRKVPAELAEQDIRELISGFLGPLQQIPPMHSAVKRGGRRLYELARKGLEVERKPRNIEIYAIDLVDFFPPNRAIIDIECSKGTYIRTLCHDMGVKSGYGAIMSYLVRLLSGAFTLEHAVTVEELIIAAKNKDFTGLILPLDYPLHHIKKASVRGDALKYFLNGNPLYPHNFLSDISGFTQGQLVRLYYNKIFIGLGICTRDGENIRIKLKCMLTGARTPKELNEQT